MGWLVDFARYHGLRMLALEQEARRGREITPSYRDLGHRYVTDWRGARCLFVLSTGRAGTKTLARALAQSPHTDAYHEPIPTLAHASSAAYAAGGPAAQTSDRWELVVDAGRAEYVAKAFDDQQVYVETNNRLAYLAPSLARFFPDSQFVFLHRHPFEVIRSGLARGWYHSNGWDWCRIAPRRGDPMHDRWQELDQVGKIAWLWSATNGFILDALEPLDPERWTEVRSADLYRDGVATTNRLLRFMGLPELSDRQLRRVFRSDINATMTPAPGDPSAFENARTLLSPLAQRLGYEI